MKGKRQSTVEPVLGALTQFLGMRKINTLDLKQANKCMHLSAIAYNLKKYLKFIKNNPKSIAGVIANICCSPNRQMRSHIMSFKQPIFLTESNLLKLKTVKISYLVIF